MTACNSCPLLLTAGKCHRMFIAVFGQIKLSEYFITAMRFLCVCYLLIRDAQHHFVPDTFVKELMIDVLHDHIADFQQLLLKRL